MNIEILKNLSIELPTELNDFMESGHGSAYDYAHEVANGDSDVIYHSKAEELYNSASTVERDSAEDMAKDCGSLETCNSMAERFTVLAYWIVYDRTIKELQEQAEDVASEVDDKISELYELKSALDDI